MIRIFCIEREERKRDLIPLFGLGSTRSGKGTDAGEESAKLAALCSLVKEDTRRDALGTTLHEDKGFFSLHQAMLSTGVLDTKSKCQYS